MRDAHRLLILLPPLFPDIPAANPPRLPAVLFFLDRGAESPFSVMYILSGVISVPGGSLRV